ncbi:gastrula zinc finger protein XlCGF57.1-like [Dermacentor albipictus]|uniref:gastrula zinc finger protein XlCGF57.1-like n=1 Tax=Dermacentor albipictus TaxID=60249 RepID=UPI0031FC6FA7
MARKGKAETTAPNTKSGGGQTGPGKNSVGGSSDSGSLDDDPRASDGYEAPRPKRGRRRRRDASSRMCGICERTFSNRSAVRRHLVTHTGAKDFSCTVCGRQFALKGTLVAHTLTHSGAKPYHCRLCPGVFSQRCSLNRHLRRTHKREK